MSRKPEIDARVEKLQNAIGKALWEIQGVEQMLAKYHAIVFQLDSEPTLTAAEIEKQFEENFNHTVGRLVGLIKKADGGNGIAVEELENFVSERNWLVHKFRREVYLSLTTDDAFEKVITRVQALDRKSSELIDMFHNKLIQYFVGLGTPKELIETEQAKVLHEIYGS
ncbi:MAG: hypothetical protein AB1513_06020 [Pseudomonadota bacterium]